MALIFSANLDGQGGAVRHEPVTLVHFYLESARDFALESISSEDEFQPLREVISAITFSAMCIEALICELAEEQVPTNKARAFDRCQKPYLRPKGQAAAAFKYAWLVRDKFSKEVPEEILAEIGKVFEYRNRLVHYKVSENQGAHHMEPPTRRFNPDGSVTVSFVLSGTPIKSEPPFVHQLTEDSAASCYNAARNAIRFWVTCGGFEWDEGEFGVLAANNSLKADGTDVPPP